MTDRELMQMALDALEWCYDVTEWPASGKTPQDRAIEALRARLAQPDHSEDKLEMVLKSQQEPLIDMSYDAVIKRCLPEKPKVEKN